MASTSTPPCGLAPIHGLPPCAQAMLHRELLLVHVLLAQVHALLHIPLSIRIIPFMSRVTTPSSPGRIGQHTPPRSSAQPHCGPLHPRAPHRYGPPSYRSFNRARNNWKTNLKAALTLAIVHLFLLGPILPILLRPHRALRGLPIPLPGCLYLPVRYLLAIYHDIGFISARDLAPARALLDLRFSVSPYLLPATQKKRKEKFLSWFSLGILFYVPTDFFHFQDLACCCRHLYTSLSPLLGSRPRYYHSTR